MAAHSLNAVEGREMRTGTACTPASQAAEGEARHYERTGWLSRCSPTRSTSGDWPVCVTIIAPKGPATPSERSKWRASRAVTKLSLAEGPLLRVLSRTAMMADEWSSLCKAVTPGVSFDRENQPARCESRPLLSTHIAIQPVILPGTISLSAQSIVICAR
ncbi:hypothetical protein K458DRAFT_403874 [Lentithecium fluviatile CBS 122367]|uniref:Uncharacterized protein n=1 Tax=Lentithecium fluviatile CBS 122367 TaxID=1168545 RepID=A0A6G1J3F5_9PLEO|nr:hypothetical protein K458DRAFT_403874 [Lentithecium fluviatile CBS 122367]